MSKIILPNGLGRKKKEDPKDGKFQIKDILPKLAKRELTEGVRNWYANGWWGDQGSTSQCVGYAWTHYLEDGPVTQIVAPPPIVLPEGVYKMAQKIDEWAGENYDGTSVRAGAKVLQTFGFIGEYRWAWDLQTLIHAVLTTGPVVVGTTWYMDMFYPEGPKGLIKIGGRMAGGHAYLINGVNTKTGMFRIKNSWGRGWGNKGFATISFEDMETLIHEDGEICLATEIKKVA